MTKKAYLDDNLAREQFADATRLLNKQHQSSFEKLEQWKEHQMAFLAKTPAIDSIHDAEIEIINLETYVADQDDMEKAGIKALAALGEVRFAFRYCVSNSYFVL